MFSLEMEIGENESLLQGAKEMLKRKFWAAKQVI